MLDTEETVFVNLLNLAVRTGWTLDYCYSLDVDVVNDILDVLEAMEKARIYLQERAARKSSGRRK